MKSPREIREEITERIIDALARGVLPWRRPWSSQGPGQHSNIVSKRSYQGINPILLEIHALKHGLLSRWWGTYRQWQQLGGFVKKRPDDVPPGDWGCRIVFYKPLTKTVVDADTGQETKDKFFVMRTFNVLNLDQVEGEALDDYRISTGVSNSSAEPDFGPAEELIERTSADIRIGGDRAFYASPIPAGSWPSHSGGDYIVVPPKGSFTSKGAFYETAFHELGHWTGPRLGWSSSRPMEEMVVEIASCYLTAELGISCGETFQNHAAYIETWGWMDEMKADCSFIIKASAQASTVTNYLLSFTGQLHPDSAAFAEFSWS